MDLLDIISALQEKERRGGYETLAPHEKVVLDVAALEAEINNGGFHQFFFNSAADRVKAVIDALEIVGAPHAAEIVADACRLFPDGGPRADRQTRQEQLELLDEDCFEALDERFYAYPDALGELSQAYWDEQQDAIEPD